MLTDDLVASLVVKNLNVSQNSALEIADSEFAAEIEDCTTVLEQRFPKNDGTTLVCF
jgi:hypothetical protein